MRRASWWPLLVGGVLAVSLAPRGETSPGDLPERDMLELGRRLFAEPAASLGGRGACIDCHLPEHGFDDPRPRSADDTSMTARRSQPLHDLLESTGLHWDGSIPNLEALIELRVTGQGASSGGRGSGRQPRGSGGWTPALRSVLDAHTVNELRAERFREVHATLGTDVVPVVRPPEGEGVGARLVAGRRYQDLFELAGVHQPRQVEQIVVRSIAAYVRSLASGETAVDRLARGELARLDDDAQRGYDLFRGRAGCATCHVVRADAKGRAPLRDEKFHNTGVAWRSHVAGMEARRTELARLETPKASPSDRARADVLRERLRAEDVALRAAAQAGGALVEVGRGKRDLKTPTLRDVSRRKRFMHDGSFGSLEEVVRWYASGCGDDPLKDPRLRAFQASDQDVADLVAFLRSLTGEVRAGLTATPWRDRGERTCLTLVDADGAPLVGVAVRVEPAGDLAWAGGRMGTPLRLTTDDAGRIAYPVGDTTQVRILADGLAAPHGGDLVPDVCREATLRYPVRGRMRLQVVCDGGAAPPETLAVWRVADAHEAPSNLAATPAERRRVRDATLVDADALHLRRTGIEARMPVGAPPGEGPELVVRYEGARPVGWTTALVVPPDDRTARRVDVASLAVAAPAR